jgi:ABC-type uncharacterized transport system YnjBCD ATPase subunit
VRAPLAFTFVLLASCVGPEASDPVLCQDAIHRLCLPPRCPVVESSLAAGTTCEATLLAASGCGASTFSFGVAGAPTRDRFLECRGNLVRVSTNVETAPVCEDVDILFNNCAEVVRFLKGAK